MAEIKEGTTVVANVDPTNGIEICDFDEQSFQLTIRNVEGDVSYFTVDNSGDGGPVVRPNNPPA